MKLKFTHFTPQSLLRWQTGQVSLPESISNLGPGGVALLTAASEQQQQKENLAEMCELKIVKF